MGLRYNNKFTILLLILILSIYDLSNDDENFSEISLI